MNIKIISKYPENIIQAYIGKTGILRIKEKDISSLGIKKGQKWLFGLDLDETTPKRSIFLIKTEDKISKQSRSLYYASNSYFININLVISELKLIVPLKCSIEIFKENLYEGLKIILL